LLYLRIGFPAHFHHQICENKIIFSTNEKNKTNSIKNNNKTRRRFKGLETAIKRIPSQVNFFKKAVVNSELITNNSVHTS
jgi:hypothetical protein